MSSRRASSRTGASIAQRHGGYPRSIYYRFAALRIARLQAVASPNIGQLFLTAHVGCLLRKSLVHWIAISFGKHATRSSTRGLLLRDRLRNRRVSDVGGMSLS